MLENQPATSTPSNSSAATTSAMPASQASTLTSRRPRDGSPNGSHRQRRGRSGATGGSMVATCTACVADRTLSSATLC